MENNNKDLFELMTKMYSEMRDIKAEQQKTTEKLGSLEKKLGNIENKVNELSIKVEQDIEPKIQALFDGYSTNTEQLSTIKGEILRYDEVIMRSIK